VLIFYREDKEDREKSRVIRSSGTSGEKDGFGLPTVGFGVKLCKP